MIERIETERLRIRDVHASDGDAFYRYMKHEDYWRNLPMQPPTLESVRSFVEKCLREQTGNPRTNYFLAAVSKETGEVIGEAIFADCKLAARSSRDRVGCGWAIHRPWLGSGDWPSHAELWLRSRPVSALPQCHVENTPSLRIMAKLAMPEEGILRENVKARGQWWSSSQWSIIRTEHE